MDATGDLTLEDAGISEVEAGFGEMVHENLRQNIGLADQKATFLIAMVGAALAFLQDKGICQQWIQSPLAWGVGDLFAFVCVMALLAGAFAALLTILPRFSKAPPGVVYFLGISQYEGPDVYAGTVTGMTRMDLYRAWLRDSYYLSHVCSRKFRWVSRATMAAAIGLGLAILHIAFAGPKGA